MLMLKQLQIAVANNANIIFCIQTLLKTVIKLVQTKVSNLQKSDYYKYLK